MKDTSPGKIIVPLGLLTEEHELSTARLLASYGDDVIFIVPSRHKLAHTPDILYRDQRWEIKSPVGKNKTTIANNLKRAVKQSPFIILDTRRTPITHKQIIKEVERTIKLTKSIKAIIVITKSSKIIEFKK